MNYSLASDCLKFLSIDMVEQAGSGHPGAAMGMSDFFTVLFSDFLSYNPKDPVWQNRDRLILSNGHASTILYSALYLSGYPDIDIEDLQEYRKINALAAGHPEYQHFAGIEATTGPLGQGIAMGVGMAMAEVLLHRDHPVIDHSTYVVLGDGCLMEGISYEAAAFAGCQKLSKLTVLFDDNEITIEGSTSLSTVEDRCKEFENMGWSTHRADGHDHNSIRQALRQAKESNLPAFVAMKTLIGKGSPGKEGRAIAHGTPLGAEEMEVTRAASKWNYAAFELPEEGKKIWESFSKKSKGAYEHWQAKYHALHAEEKAELERRKALNVPLTLKEQLLQLKKSFIKESQQLPVRKGSVFVLNKISAAMPELIGGSGDLGESSGAWGKAMISIFPENNYKGNYIHYGIREQFIAAAINGFAIYGSFKAYASTYFVFSDYMKAAMRLAALMNVPAIYLFSHDSIGVGADGPTHQAVEQLAGLRAMPNLNVYRPADIVESIECWELALQEKSKPSALVMARQNSNSVRNTTHSLQYNLCSQGAYVIRESRIEQEKVRLYASGSEVSSCVKAAEKLESQKGLGVSVISVPCRELLEVQDKSYRDFILAKNSTVLKVVVEAAVNSNWHELFEGNCKFIGMTSFGTTGESDELFTHFGLDAESIARKVSICLP